MLSGLGLARPLTLMGEWTGRAAFVLVVALRVVVAVLVLVLLPVVVVVVVAALGGGPIFMQVSSWMMFAIGAVYMMLGTCCLRGWRDKMKQKEKDDWHQYRQDLKAWKQQQKEA